MPNRLPLIVEFVLLYVLPPLVYLLQWLPRASMMPLLWGVFGYTVWVLHRHRQNLKWDIKPGMLLPLVWRSIVVGAALAAFTLLAMPQNFLQFAVNKPHAWLLVMLLYPPLSAFTQEVVFRRFFFFRYRALFRHNETLLMLASALLFSYMHIVFFNSIAVVFTLIGGLMFAHHYRQTGSLWLAALEHAVYGNMVFTVGLGYFFYHGAA